MKIKLIDFGVPESRRPFRPHGNDAGADVYMPYDCTLQPGEIAKVPLAFGIISNVSNKPQELSKGSRVGQLVITPVVIADFVTELGEQRGTGGFGSTGV